MRSILKDNASRLDLALRAFDPLLIFATGYIAYRLYLGSWDPPARYVTALVVATALGFAAFPSLGLYRSRRGTSFVDEAAGLFFAWLLIAVTGGAFLFLTKSGADFSRGWALTWIVGGLLFHAASRGVDARRAALVAASRPQPATRDHRRCGIARPRRGGTIARSAVERPRDSRVLRRRSAADRHDRRRHSRTRSDRPTGRRNPRRRCGSGVDRVAAPRRGAHPPMRRRPSHDVGRHPFVPDIYGFHLLNHSITEIAGMPVLNLTDTPMTDARFAWKGLEDMLLGTLLCIVALPFIVLIAIGIKAVVARARSSIRRSA